MMRYIFCIAMSTIVFSGIAQTPRIVFKDAFFYPEGIVYNNQSHLFYTGSVKTGTIITVDHAGNYKDFYVDPSLKSSFGMKVDSINGCLWVCTGDPNYSVYKDSSTFKKMIRLVAIDLNTGQKIKDIDLSSLYNGKHFANDLTMDNLGNIYITDSYSPVIYKVDKSGAATIFAENVLFKALDIGLNGIVWHPSGFIITVNNSTGALYKISTTSPYSVTAIKTGTFFPGGDGLLVDAKGNLLLAQNKGVNKIFALSSTDNWQSARITGATSVQDRFQNPSTITLKDGKVYICNSKLNELQDPGMTPSKEFSFQQAIFKTVPKMTL